MSLVYIIIRPIAIYEEVPDQHKTDRDSKGGVFGHNLRGIC